MLRNKRTHLNIKLCVVCQRLPRAARSCVMLWLFTLTVARTPWQGRRGRAAVQLRAVRGLWSPLLRLCSFLSRPYSPPPRRSPPDNAVATCSTQPGMTDVREQDCCQRLGGCVTETAKSLWVCTVCGRSCISVSALSPHSQTNVTLIFLSSTCLVFVRVFRLVSKDWISDSPAVLRN